MRGIDDNAPKRKVYIELRGGQVVNDISPDDVEVHIVDWDDLGEMMCPECGNAWIYLDQEDPSHFVCNNGHRFTEEEWEIHDREEHEKIHGDVELVIANYMWTCPGCKTTNSVRPFMIEEKAICYHCGKKYNPVLPEAA